MSGKLGDLRFDLERAGDKGVRITCVPHTLGEDAIVSTVERHAKRVLSEALVVQGQRFNLRWEELDPKGQRVQRRSAPVGSTLYAHLTQGSGVELRAVTESAPPLWLPADHRATLPAGCYARVGWTVQPPSLTWRYANEDGIVGVRVIWECEGLPEAWLSALPEAELAAFECELDPGGSVRLVRIPGRAARLRLEGRAPLGEGPLPLLRRLRCTPPLALAEPGETAVLDLDEELPAAFTVRELWAWIDGRVTRFVTMDEDQDKPFALAVETDLDTVLPDSFPVESLRQLPWELRVTAGTRGRDARLWELRAHVPADSLRGTWSEVDWDGTPATLALTLAVSTSVPADPPRIRRIQNRRVRRAWEVEHGRSQQGLLRLVRPIWSALDTSLPELNDVDAGTPAFQQLVHIMVQGSEEWFEKDSASEVPEQTLLLDPERWRVHDAAGAEVKDPEVYGSVAGAVRWRRPSIADASSAVAPATWAAGSGTVLLVSGGPAPTAGWGGFWVPEQVPWAQLQERVPVACGAGDLCIHVDPRHAELWIYLWGSVARYRRHTLRLDLLSEIRQVTAWVLSVPLPFFPSDDAVLLRAFSPLCVVQEPGSVLRLTPESPRPTLSVGTELLAAQRAGRMFTVELAAATRICWAPCAPGQLPPSLAATGRIAEFSAGTVGSADVWIALDQGDPPASAGYLLSRDADGQWQFRGFYAGESYAVALGESRDGSARRLLLTERRMALGRRFAKTVSPDSAVSWEGDVPPEWLEIGSGNGGPSLNDMLARFRSSTDRLSDGSTRTVYTEIEDGNERVHGIRVWELPASAESMRTEQENGAPSEEPVYVD